MLSTSDLCSVIKVVVKVGNGKSTSLQKLIVSFSYILLSVVTLFHTGHQAYIEASGFLLFLLADSTGKVGQCLLALESRVLDDP